MTGEVGEVTMILKPNNDKLMMQTDDDDIIDECNNTMTYY